MLLISISLALITIIAAVVQTISFRRLCDYVEAELSIERPSFQPRASVILPCKGLDPGFADNIARLLDQDYPDFEVIFAVADRNDPAYESLVEFSENSAGKAQVVVAGIDTGRAQKLNNQLCALKSACPKSEVLVFVDSDVIASDDFLTCLISPLADQTIGVTTGYRFYVSSPGNLPSILRSLWNRMSAWEMASKHAFAWGGAMAISRKVFEKAAVAQAWDRSCDDDLALTTCVKAIGLSVHFVPRCLVATKGDASFSEIVEWTNRQLILTKIYYRPLWLRAIARAVVMFVWLLAMLSALVGLSVFRDQGCLIALFAGATIFPIEVYFLLVARRLWGKVFAERTHHRQESLLSSCIAIPLAHFVLPFMTLFSILTNRIQWRGVTYELKSAHEILIIS